MGVFIGIMSVESGNEYVSVHYFWFCCMYRVHTPLQEGIGMKLQVMPL